MSPPTAPSRTAPTRTCSRRPPTPWRSAPRSSACTTRSAPERGLPALRENATPALRRRCGHARGHGLPPLLRPHAPGGSTMVDRIMGARYTSRNAGLVGGREHRLGHRKPGHAPRDRARLDAVARAPREHPQAAPTASIGIGVVTGTPTAARAAPRTRRTSGSAARQGTSLRRRMADVQPFRALHYDLDAVGGLQAVAAPPYDVIDDEQRAALVAPLAAQRRRDRPAARRRRSLRPRRRAVRAPGSARACSTRDAEPALWALAQDYTGPDGRAAHPSRLLRARARRGLRARAGSARTSAPTPGPKEDRLRLTRATQREPVADLLALRRPRPGRRGARVARHARRPAVGRGHRRGRHAPPAVAGRRPRGGGGRDRCAVGHRAADRRRPPPLRDRARVPPGGRRRARADVPRRAPGPGPDRLPHPPAGHRPRRRAQRRRCARRSSATGRPRPSTPAALEPDRGRAGADRLLRRPPPAPADADPARPGDRRRRAARQARALPAARHRGARGAASSRARWA